MQEYNAVSRTREGHIQFVEQLLGAVVTRYRSVDNTDYKNKLEEIYGELQTFSELLDNDNTKQRDLNTSITRITEINESIGNTFNIDDEGMESLCSARDHKVLLIKHHAENEKQKKLLAELGVAATPQNACYTKDLSEVKAGLMVIGPISAALAAPILTSYMLGGLSDVDGLNSGEKAIVSIISIVAVSIVIACAIEAYTYVEKIKTIDGDIKSVKSSLSTQVNDDASQLTLDKLSAAMKTKSELTTKVELALNTHKQYTKGYLGSALKDAQDVLGSSK